MQHWSVHCNAVQYHVVYTVQYSLTVQWGTVQGCAPEQSPPHIGTDIPDDLPQWPMKVHCVSLTCDMWSVCVAYVCIWILGTMEANR